MRHRPSPRRRQHWRPTADRACSTAAARPRLWRPAVPRYPASAYGKEQSGEKNERTKKKGKRRRTAPDGRAAVAGRPPQIARHATPPFGSPRRPLAAATTHERGRRRCRARAGLIRPRRLARPRPPRRACSRRRSPARTRAAAYVWPRCRRPSRARHAASDGRSTVPRPPPRAAPAGRRPSHAIGRPHMERNHRWKGKGKKKKGKEKWKGPMLM